MSYYNIQHPHQSTLSGALSGNLPGSLSGTLPSASRSISPAYVSMNMGNVNSANLPYLPTSLSRQYALQQSVSPSLSRSISSSRARFNAGRGFDLQDDWEFCPELYDQSAYSYPSPNCSPVLQGEIVPGSAYSSSSHSYSSSNSPPSYYYRSPSGSAKKNNNASPKSYSSSSSPGRSNTSRSKSPFVSSRVKKVLDIVNPNTGLRVPSPSPLKHR